MIILFALILLLGFAQVGMGSTTQNKAYVLEQMQIKNHTIIYATKDGVRLKHLLWRVEMVTKAPTWEVVVYSRITKTYAKESMDLWVTEGLDVTRDTKRPVFPATKRIGTMHSFGFESGLYYEPCRFTVIDALTREKLKLITGLRYQLLDKSAFDPNVSLAISSIYGLLPCRQLVLSADRYYPEKGWVPDLRTIRFKEISLKEAQIEYPNLAGYREAESPTAVELSSPTRNPGIDVLFPSGKK